MVAALAAGLTLAAIELDAPPAEACGVKLRLKMRRGPKAGARGEVAARQPIRTNEKRTPIAVGPDRVPIGARPTDDPRVVVAAKQPPEPKAASEPMAQLVHDELYFTTGSAALPNNSSLDKTVKWLRENPGATVTIEGHADATDRATPTVSQLRANAVRDQLIAEGIEGSRLQVKAFGDTRPMYGANDGRNRRVSIDAKK